MKMIAAKIPAPFSSVANLIDILMHTRQAQTSDILPLTDSLGLHPALGKLKGLYDEGMLAVVQGVGYPNPNRSHFRSMDIWHTAKPETMERSGWLGRYLDACQCGQDQPLPAVSVKSKAFTPPRVH